MKPSPKTSNADLVADLVRAEDTDRYLISLFQPMKLQRAALALAAWNLELARARPRSGEVTIGMMRLQWHRDALAEIARGEVRRHPVIMELADAYGDGVLDLVDLERIVDARERDMDAAPTATLGELEDYARQTAGALHAALWRPTSPEAANTAETAGAAFGLIGLARAEPANQARGRPWAPKALKGGLRPIVERARELAKAAEPVKGARGARAPAVLAESYVARAVAAKADPTDRRMLDPDPRRMWRMFGARLRGRL